MAKLPRNLSRAALLSVASTVALSSCALPPREALHKIHDDGLIAYIKYELNPAQESAPADTPAATKPATRHSGSSEMVLAQRNMIQSLQEDEAGAPLTAITVSALPGYVRSPYTTPPRLVDVRGVRSGTTMVCPYTRRKFIVPGAAGFVATPSTMLAQQHTSRVSAPERLTPRPTVKPKSDSLPVELNDEPAPTPAPTSTPSKAAEDKPVTKPSPSVPMMADTTPAPAPAPPPPAPKPVQEIPYGEAVPGRPGFVISPYAAKHQLVDVAGLPAGMEVKCPYTGKLFRVPMPDMASTRGVETVAPQKQ